MKKPSMGYVYVASVKNNPNLCKVGYTKGNPKDRVSKLKRDYPDYEFELYRAFEFDRPKRHEAMAHKILHQHNIERELFGVTPIEACIAVQRTVGKWFDVITADGFDYKFTKTELGINLTDGNVALGYFNYIKHNLNLEFTPEISFVDFKNLINTYMEFYNARSAYDISPDLLINLCKEAGL